jgi:sugar-specific transcriptional regulator TrmB
VKRTSIYNFIDRLVEIGLASKTIIKNRRYYQALPPDQLVELARARTRELEEKMPELASLREQFGNRFRVHYFEGEKETKNIVREELNCKKEALYIWPGKDIMQMIGGSQYMSQIDKQRIQNGVRVRTIRFKKKDIPYGMSGHGEKFLRTMRFAPPSFDVSMGMGVYDSNKVSFFSSKKEGFAVLIESEELTQMMRKFYELLWNECIPAREGDG